jgi:hypothetical protein
MWSGFLALAKQLRRSRVVELVAVWGILAIGRLSA